MVGLHVMVSGLKHHVQRVILDEVDVSMSAVIQTDSKELISLVNKLIY